MKRLVQAVLLLALTGSAAFSADYWALNVSSYHFDRSNPLNESNLGLGYGRKSESCGTEAGGYWNSHDKFTVYGMGFCEMAMRDNDAFRAGAYLGIATGYQDIPDNYRGIIPIIGLQLSAGPVVMRINPEVAFFSLRFPID